MARAQLRFIPHILTLLACSAGLVAVLLAVNGRYEAAVLFVLAAAVLDGLDGRVARMLNASSQFGVEFDSLSDVVAFGVAPGLILYHWLFFDLQSEWGWIVVVVLGVCAALRLARFNAEKIAEQDLEPTVQNPFYFTGLAAPSAALLALLPMMISFGIWPDLTEQLWVELAVALWVLAIGFLMISRVPTFSFKGGNFVREHAVLLSFAAGLVGILFVFSPWTMLAVASGAYALSIPLAYLCCQRGIAN